MDHQENDESYYLGNIVLYPEGKNWVVIDGQQRLTTVMLLLNSLFSIAQTATILEECIKRKDPLTGQKVNQLKIETRVIEGDKKELEEVILDNETTGSSRIKRNYRLLYENLTDWIHKNHFGAEAINAFILTVLNRIVLLPIQCDSIDDALIIFNTLNNRGLPLSDADIFKAQLFKYVTNNEEAKKELVCRWNNLNTNTGGEIESLFRRLMHIKRAEEKITAKEIGLRKYFENKDIFKDWTSVLSSLEKINHIDEQNVFPPVLENLWKILHYVPNEYCLYPIIVYWYKHAEPMNENEWKLSDKQLKNFEQLVYATIKYYYASAIAYNSVNAVKDTTYKVCCAIANDEEYKEFYLKDYDKTYEIFKMKLKNYEYGRCRQGLVALLAVLNPKQNQEDLISVAKWEIEHILPQRGGYHNYNGWNEVQYNQKLNTLGNLVLLEKILNIRASNEFFEKKKTEYKKSVIQEAKDLVKIKDWTFDEWEKRHKVKEKQLLKFFHITK